MRKTFSMLAAMLFAVLLCVTSAMAAQLQVVLPLGRTDYQTNERIDISVVRSDAQALPAGMLSMDVTGADGSLMNFVFPVQAVPVAGNAAKTTEHLHLNGWLLRPGKYLIAVTSDGAKVETPINVFSHIRRSTYRTIHWGGPSGAAMTPEGEDGMGFNLILGGVDEPSIRGGVDIMGNCLMGGGHQHDLRLTNDWSDPNVYIGAIQRGLDRAFSFRTMPNAIGAHLHDEPGLTWATHPHTGKMGPHDIKQQREAYKRVYGVDPIWFDEVDAKDPQKLAEWQKINDFKLGFMDAFWKASKEDLERLKPGYLSVTQSQYGWSALFDGYYFNVARSMPIVSGHGGYNDFWLRNFNPSLFLEMALPRQLDKPTWYLPEWYGNISTDEFRLEHNLSFITGIQGMSTPPGVNINSPAASGVTESNKLFARLGTIFTKPEATRQDLAMLYSKSNSYYNLGSTQMGDIATTYMATKMIQYPLSVVLDEDIIDGSITEHKAVVVAGVKYLDPAVVAGLEAYVKTGGVVITTADTTVKITGATMIDVVPDALATKAQEDLKKVTGADAIKAATTKTNAFRSQLEYATPMAKALKAALLKANIKPTFDSNLETIASGKQVRGEIEYDFAVNYTVEPGYSEANGGVGVPIAAKATISLPADGRPVYDAVRGGQMTEFAKKGMALTGTIQLGPGQMLAIARTARPIGGVQIGMPVINRDLTRETDVQRIEFTATLVDAQLGLLAGTAPLQIKVIDPLGVVRYDLYRATDQGVCAMSLPLAANDPAGKWTVSVKELLSNTENSASFVYKPSAQMGAVAGMSQRAFFFPDDKANIYRFFREQRQIAIVAGNGDANAAAAARLAEAVKPYNITATIIPLADANKARPLTDEEAKTWCGTSAAGTLDQNARNNPGVVGYNLPSATVLIGSVADNPLIKRLQDAKVLPYKVTADFPGTGRGMLVWNLMALGHDVETIACIGNDAAGVNEAIGTLVQIGIGVDPLTPLALPASNSITPASEPFGKVAVAPILWQVVLPDRVDAVVAEGANVTAYSANGMSFILDAKGKLVKSEVAKVPAAGKPNTDVKMLPKEKLAADLKVKQVLAGTGITAVAYYGGRLQVFDAAGAVKTEQQLPQDITALACGGTTLAVGLADGTLLALDVK